MNRKTLALTLILALLIPTLAATLLVQVVTANPFMPSGSWSDDPIPPSINVQSPTETINYWIGSDVWLDFTVTVPLTSWYSKSMNPYPDHYATTFGTITGVRFSLDGMSAKEATKVSEHQGVLSYSVNLGRLFVGRHTIVIRAEGSAHYGNLAHDLYSGSNYTFQESAKTKLVQSSLSINFFIDGVRPTSPPNITLLSPTNTTYYYIGDWTSIPYVRLEYKADDTRLSIGYSFDDESNITPAMNGTTIYIPIESRMVTLYANDSFGNSATPQTVHYEILRDPRSAFGPQSPPESFQTTLIAMRQKFLASVIALAVSSTIIGIGLLVYFKKHRGSRNL